MPRQKLRKRYTTLVHNLRQCWILKPKVQHFKITRLRYGLWNLYLREIHWHVLKSFSEMSSVTLLYAMLMRTLTSQMPMKIEMKFNKQSQHSSQRIYIWLTLASSFVKKSTKAKPRCVPVPLTFFGIRTDLSSPKTLSTIASNVHHSKKHWISVVYHSWLTLKWHCSYMAKITVSQKLWQLKQFYEI